MMINYSMYYGELAGTPSLDTVDWLGIGFIYASHAAEGGSIPGCGKSASHQTASGAAAAENAHSLAHKINPTTASLVPRQRVAQGYRKGDEHLRRSCLMEGPKFAFFFAFAHCLLLCHYHYVETINAEQHLLNENK